MTQENILKTLLLHGRKIKQSLLFGHTVHSKKTYETMFTLIELMKYEQYILRFTDQVYQIFMFLVPME